MGKGTGCFLGLSRKLSRKLGAAMSYEKNFLLKIAISNVLKKNLVEDFSQLLNQNHYTVVRVVAKAPIV